MSSRYLLLPASVLVAGLVGCASVPSDWGRADVGRLAAERGHPVPEGADARAFTDRTLASPLTADRAVQLALLNNPVMRRQAAELGFAAAEVYDAGRLANPTFSLTRLAGDSSAGANVPQLTLGIAFNFVNLLFLPANTRFAKAQLEAAKLNVAAAALDLAADVEAAWYETVGADQLAQMREAAAKAQRASATLAQRYFDAGNISQRELAMEQASASQAALGAISARAEAVEARTRLNKLLGLSADQGRWTLDARLAEPLPKDDAENDLQRLAMDSRLDVAAARRTAQALADRYGITRRTRLINDIEVGVERERDYDGALDVGPTLSLELPLFNWGGGRTAAIQAALLRAEADLDQAVLDLSNDVQLGAAKVAATRARVEEFWRALIPAQETVVEQAQREQNYMLIGIFEVILAKQQTYDAYAGYIEAVRDYWVARAELGRAVGRELPSSRQAGAPTVDAADLLRPKGGGMDHSKHSMGGMGHDMKGMEGMNPSERGGTAAPDPHAGHSMQDMKGMRQEPAAGKGSTNAPDAHRGHSMPEHDMKAMPGMSMPGHDMKSMPGAQTPSANSSAPAQKATGHDMSGMEEKGSDADGVKAACASPQAPHSSGTVQDAIARQCEEQAAPVPSAPSAEPQPRHDHH